MSDFEPPDGPPAPSPDGEGATVRRILFVCTGNTCRSPMAEAIARDLAEKRGLRDVELRSAGAGAFPGAPPSGGAVRVARGRGLDLGAHRATLLTRRDVEWADLILTMSPSHLARVHDLGGGARAHLLTAFARGVPAGVDSGTVPDPIGGTDEEYRTTFERLEDLVGQVFDRVAGKEEA